MLSAPEPYHRLLLPTDLGEAAPDTFAHAFRLVLASGGNLQVVHVHMPGQTPGWADVPSARDVLVKWGKLGEDDGVEAFERLGVRVRFSGVGSLELEDPITDMAKTMVPDLMVLSTHARKGFDRLRMPSVGEDLARKVARPTLLLPKGGRPFVDPGSGSVSLRRLLVPVGSVAEANVASREAMRLVVSYAAAPAEFVLVHVGGRDTLEHLTLPKDDPRWTWRFDTRHGPLVEEILSAIEAHDVDAVVMTTHGHDSFYDRLAGSHTEQVLRESPVPVLAIPVGD